MDVDFSLLRGDDPPDAGLVVFGSLVGFTAYVWLLKVTTPARVSTYAYVNPVVAVILGAIFLSEHLVSTEYVGMIAIVIAVALVTSARLRVGAKHQKTKAADREPIEV